MAPTALRAGTGKAMAQTCRKCSRTNPPEAAYCHFDGSALEGHGPRHGPLQAGTRRFHHPFVFPSGRACENFDQLALACCEHWPEAVGLLHLGHFEHFLSGLGRADLALAARAAATFPDPDRGLDQLLDRLPGRVLAPARLEVRPRDVNLGRLRVGQDLRLDVQVQNGGQRLLHGSIRCEEGAWLALGDGAGQPRKQFQIQGDHEQTFAVRVCGRQLRAGNQPLEGLLVVESNAGSAQVRVRAEVPVTPFAHGALAGATSPRQVAEKAKRSAREAAILFETGLVADWYRANGWTYPVPGPAASGLGAVQQFFEALALTQPPAVVISEREVNLTGKVGDRIEHPIEVRAEERRPVYAHAQSDRAWLQAGPVRPRGRVAAIPLVVPAVPDAPGELLSARVEVTANGNQRFSVRVNLAVAGRPGASPTVVRVGDEFLPTVVEGPVAELPPVEVLDEATPGDRVPVRGPRRRRIGT